MEGEDSIDVLVVGGGVVGLAVLRAATLAGWKCALIEREPDLLTWASGSNSGIVCTGVDASPGTLERALIRESISSIRIFCRQMNVPMRECGSLVCQWDEADQLDQVLQESLEAGDTHACRLSGSEVLEREKDLNPSCKGAVHIPGEIVVDPWLYSIALGVQARQNGAKIFTSTEMDPKASSFDGSLWTMGIIDARDPVNTPKRLSIRARAVVNATGAWAEKVPSEVHTTERKWSIRPRRGQYRIYGAQPDMLHLTCPIQPIPTQVTKGIFVFSSLYNQIVVGPTAEDQESKTDRSVNERVGRDLTECCKRILPALDTSESNIVGEYVGIRPGTNKRDYQIQLNTEKNWVDCTGIRSTGLTASLGIGRHVAYLLAQCVPKDSDADNSSSVRTRPLPAPRELCNNFHTRNDGCVDIDGHAYRVTHPITKLGWKARSGLASSSEVME